MLKRLGVIALTTLMFWVVIVFFGAAVSVWVALWFQDFAGLWDAWLRVFSTPTLIWTGFAAIGLAAVITAVNRPASRNPPEGHLD